MKGRIGRTHSRGEGREDRDRRREGLRQPGSKKEGVDSIGKQNWQTVLATKSGGVETTGIVYVRGGGLGIKKGGGGGNCRRG
jgi:hypothetical protein